MSADDGGRERRQVTEQWPDSQITRAFAELQNGQTETRNDVRALRDAVNELPEKLGDKFVLTKVHDLEVGELRTNQRSHGDRIDQHDTDLDSIRTVHEADVASIRSQMISKKAVGWFVGILISFAAAAGTWVAVVLGNLHAATGR